MTPNTLTLITMPAVIVTSPPMHSEIAMAMGNVVDFGATDNNVSRVLSGHRQNSVLPHPCIGTE